MADSNSPKALREERAKVAAEIQRLADGNLAVDASGNYTEAWLKVNADYNAYTNRIDAAETAAKVTAAMKDRVGDQLAGREDYDPRDGRKVSAEQLDEERTLCLAAWSKTQRGKVITGKERAACEAQGFNPGVKEQHISLFADHDFARLQRQFRGMHQTRAADRLQDFRATLTTGSGPGGGYLVAPEQMRTQLEINMLAYGSVMQVADVTTTSSGEPMSWPTSDDTTNEGVQIGETASPIASPAVSTDPTFGKVLWSAYVFSSKPVLFPYILGEDAVFDLPGVLGGMLGERLSRGINRKLTTGTGAVTAKGVVTCATLGITAASATAIAADEIIRLEHAIDPAYRDGASYMMHDTTMLALRLLKDGVGRYLWSSGLEGGTPDTLNNRPLTINQHMTALATGVKSILFGQFNKYKVRRVNQVRTYHLQERYRDQDLDAMIAFMRIDGNLLTAGTSPLVYLVHP